MPTARPTEHNFVQAHREWLCAVNNDFCDDASTRSTWDGILFETVYDPLLTSNAPAILLLTCTLYLKTNGGFDQKCVSCPEGTTGICGKCECVGSRPMVRDKCTPNPAGTFGFPRSTGCELCQGETFQNARGARECKLLQTKYFC